MPANIFILFLQAALEEAMKENSTSTFELVRCKLTLFYDYWQMDEVFLFPNMNDVFCLHASPFALTVQLYNYIYSLQELGFWTKKDR